MDQGESKQKAEVDSSEMQCLLRYSKIKIVWFQALSILKPTCFALPIEFILSAFLILAYNHIS